MPSNRQVILEESTTIYLFSKYFYKSRLTIETFLLSSIMIWLTEELYFPDPLQTEPHGIVAAGGDLKPERLLMAYHNGIFPWYDDDQPILWWSPDPRMVLFPKDLYISKSMRKLISKNVFKVTFNQSFRSVIQGCAAAKRIGQRGTWITE